MKARAVAAAVIPIALVVGFLGARALDDRNDDPGTVATNVTSGASPPQTPAATTATTTSVVTGALPLAAAAAAAQVAIDSGDDLYDCPFGPVDGIIAAVPSNIRLSPAFAQGVADEGQVFSGGDADITYCDLVPADYSSDGVVSSVRIDVAPGAPDLGTYLDEEFGADVSDVRPDASFLGGTVQVGCLTYPQDMCLAVWQGADLFVALMLRGDGPFVTSEASATLHAVLPAVVTNLAS